MSRAETLRFGAPMCAVDACLNHVIATGIDARNGDPEHGIDFIIDFTESNIEDQ